MNETIWIKLPPPLKDKKILDAVGAGLFYVSRGDRPEMIPEGSTTTTRITLSPKASAIFYEALPDFSSKKELLTLALAWVLEQPPHIRRIRI